MTPELSERIEQIGALLRTRKRTARQIAKVLKINVSAVRSTLKLMARMGLADVVGKVEHPEHSPTMVWAIVKPAIPKAPKPAKPTRPVRVKAPEPTKARQAKPKPASKVETVPAPPPIHSGPTLTRWVGGNPFARLFREDAR